MSNQTLRQLLFGKGAHANPLACLESLSAALAGEKIDASPHSIWELVGHMNYWMYYEVQRIGGQSPVYPQHATQSWPVNAVPASEGEWKEACSCFESLLGQLQALSNSAPEVMHRQVPASGPNALPATVEDVLWQMVAHNSYHLGQVVFIRQCLGTWPLPKGRDTW